MKGVVVQSLGNISIEEIPEPVCEEYDALVDILACGICSGTDNHVVDGTHFDSKNKYPLVLGHEAIGRVRTVGDKVRFLKPGDLVTRVFNKLPQSSGLSLYHGALAERGVVTDWQAMQEDGYPREKWSVFTVHRVIPKTFSPVEATLIITWRETYAFLEKLNLPTGKKVAIIGSGANARSFADHLKTHADRIVIIGSPTRAHFFEDTKIPFFSYQSSNLFEEIEQSMPEIDVCIDAVGAQETVATILPLLRDNGLIGMYGLNQYPGYSLPRGEKKYTVVEGVNYDEGGAHDTVMSAIEKGSLDAKRYISRAHYYTLPHTEDALRAAKNGDILKPVVVIKS